MCYWIIKSRFSAPRRKKMWNQIEFRKGQGDDPVVVYLCVYERKQRQIDAQRNKFHQREIKFISLPVTFFARIFRKKGKPKNQRKKKKIPIKNFNIRQWQRDEVVSLSTVPNNSVEFCAFCRIAVVRRQDKRKSERNGPKVVTRKTVCSHIKNWIIVEIKIWIIRWQCNNNACEWATFAHTHKLIFIQALTNIEWHYEWFS